MAGPHLTFGGPHPQNRTVVCPSKLQAATFRGSISAPGIFFFDQSPPVPAPPPPPNNLENLLTVSKDCPSFALVYDDGKVVGVTVCVVKFSYFGLCKVPCREGLRSTAVYLGDFPR